MKTERLAVSHDERLQELGIVLPEAQTPMAAYVPAIRTGDLLWIAGQPPGGDWRGRVGETYDIEAGARAARDSGLNILAQVRKAFADHSVIFFRNQKISPEQHMAFGAHFGVFDIHRFAAGLPDHPEVMPVVKEAGDSGGNFGGLWHSDVTFYEKQALGSILYALDAPAYGGDTMFSSQYLAYETLSDGMKDMLSGMTAVHSAKRVYGNQGTSINRFGAQVQSMQIRTGDEAEEETLSLIHI